ncbi:MAG: HEAT repeat domain-containing protein, partial [Planctomycetes bacterium]|nr:HEAT repeat domain-containing protein [Planctomycetota bacterium]
WLVAGTSKGNVAVFECEDKPNFELSATDRLHEGAVTALLFETEDLRFLSAGADNKLLSTHARGKLEPEDKGRGANHSDQVTAMIWGPADRFFTGSRDKTVKSWPRTGNMRPVTLKDGVTKVVALALVHLHKKHQLAVVCDDNSIRFFGVDDEGKFGESTVKVQDAYARAKSELNRDEVPRREAALKELAAYSDTPSIDMLAEQIGTDADHGLRLLGAQLLTASNHPRAPKLLEKWLTHNDEAVRVESFKGLRKHLGETDLNPLDLALKVDKADVGKLAVQALETLSTKDDQALSRLTEALNVKTWEVRQAALASLENVFGDDSPEGDLVGLGSKHADLRRLALVRLFQRKLLADTKVQAIVRWREEDADADVRRTAFLLTLYTRPKLVGTLRKRDLELDRQLTELETFGKEPAPQAEAKAQPETAVSKKAKHEADGKVDLAEGDYDPLLQATASRALDTCLRGARGLAVLHDTRAFGLLLQLSREEDAPARVEVCRAMAALDDPRSIKRLRSLLFDKEAAVRDAAFTALAHLHEEKPLEAAESGLTAAFEDVRRRALQLLIGETRKKKPKNEDEPTWQLMVRALNDSFPSVRSEAFKSALNLKLGGGGPDTLRFVLQSVHADIRREVLTEVMAQASEKWAWTMLLQFLNDPDPKLREEAFTFAVKKTKELEPLDAGLSSRYVDVRRSAVQGLIKKHSGPAQALLARALGDQEKEIRQLAIEALVIDDAQVALTQALDSEHDDVVVRAAKALARHGSPAALNPLLRLAMTAEPQQKEDVSDWSALVDTALEGLEELGDPEAVPSLVPILDNKVQHASHRKLAARALIWSTPAHMLDTLRSALQHADPQVKYHAALGLAYAGDAAVSSLVFSDQAKQVLKPGERLVAALTLGAAGEDQLVVFLDDPDENLRDWALVLMMLLELKANDGSPTRCLACLSSLMPRARLTAAGALETFSDPAAFAQFVVSLFNVRGEEQPWKVSADHIDSIAELVAHGSPLLKARTAYLLRFLSEKEQSAFDQAWAAHRKRFGTEIKTLKDQATSRRAPQPQYSTEQLQQLAFGAYVGLVREQGGAHAKQQRPTLGPYVVRVRQMALNRILALAQSDEHYAKAAVPVFVQALGDPNQPVRMQAFEHLQALGLDSAILGAEALEAGHTDLGVKGLEVLTDGTSKAEGENVLEHVMLTRKDELAIEAAKLLTARRPTVPVAAKALSAAHEPLRERAVNWLAAEYDKESAAQKHLREALTSRYQKVRESAAFELATKKDPAAFDALVKLLHAAQDANRQRSVITALVKLGDPRTPDALLDRLENDPTGSAQTNDLVRNAGNFRNPQTANRLLEMMEKNSKWRKACYDAIVTVSGYDQDIDDFEDERTNRDWEKKQHPRHDGILARLMERLFAAGDVKLLSDLMEGAQWSRGKDVEPILANMVNLSDADLRHSVVEAIGWRLRKRGGPVEPLLKGVQHQDPETQFLAAEGLAKAGRPEGLNVLLTSIDFLTDNDQRERAILALGELADPRALDTLLKHANDPESPLKDAAAEALGHMGRSDKAAEIFKLLERFARLNESVAINALKGLRWFNTHNAWLLIRQRATDTSFDWSGAAVEMLGFNDDPATRDLLLKLLSTDEEVVHAKTSARRLWGEESLEPDYAILQNKHVSSYDASDSLKRVSEKGDSGRILEILPNANPSHKEDLSRTVINRPDLPVEAAKKALGGNDPGTVRLAAQIVGRVGTKSADAEKVLEGAIDKWSKAWEEKRTKLTRDEDEEEDYEEDDDSGAHDRISACLQKLLWAAGRLGVAQNALIRAATTRQDDAAYRPVRLEAVTALAGGPVPDAVADVLEKAAQGNDPEIRTIAAEALGRKKAGRASKLAEKVLSDRTCFNRIAMQPNVQVDETLHKHAGQVHYQGVVLPQLIARNDLGDLSEVAENRALPEVARLGAIESLAMLATEAAEAKLLEIGQNKNEEEELRKAAWRGLKRSRRARKAKQTA